ncbi:MAG: lipoprotein-releasing ABC transporter permease subunit [Chromatiales bacterium]|nr:MAG: lipoprotein-releasing ABC transporter permease subunit [Chromatiales bacterium]
MMRPVTIFVALRYLREHRENSFASFVTVASVIGVALGVAALIVVLSVMNGFENELRDRLLSMAGHATVETSEADVLADLRRWPGITAAAPFVDLEAMLSSGGSLAGGVLSGIDPVAERSMSGLENHLRAGELDDLVAGSRAMILGRALALRLGVQVGDPVTVMVPGRGSDGRLRTALREFWLAGVFELGLRDHDSVRALVHIEDARRVVGEAGVGGGIRVRTDDVLAAPQIIRAWAGDWAGRTGSSPAVRDWTQDNATYFRAVRIEKLMMTLLLSLIVAVAAFNIVATLVMVVTDKRSGIAILRTLGYSRRSVMSVFAVQGVIVGWFGVLIGVTLGVLLALNVDTLAPALERLFGFEFMPAEVYYLTSLPADLRVADVAWIAVIALVMTALATVYPALRAASVAPAEVLRYE